MSVLVLCALFLGVNAGHNSNRYERHREALKNKDKYPGCCVEPVSLHAESSLPNSFDWCDVDGKSFCAPSWNQHQPKYCGACYVHGTLSALNDRLKIMRNGEGIDVMLARQVILNCGKKHGFGDGCGGGESSDIYEFMRQFGLPEEGCYNYLAAEAGCPDSGEGYCINCMMFGGDTTNYKCWAVDQYVKYFVKDYGYVTGEHKMMSEIYARGPITCGLVCPDEFVYGYKGGVFHYKGNDSDVDHDVEVVGWGEDEHGTPYWHVRNSWGTYWGEDGFFRVIRGINNLRIEESCAFATLDYHEEREMRTGQLEGSMFGVTRPDYDEWRFEAPNPKDPLSHRPAHEDPARRAKHHHRPTNAPIAAMPSTLLQERVLAEDSSIGFIPIFAFAIILLGLYATWSFYAKTGTTSTHDYQPI